MQIIVFCLKRWVVVVHVAGEKVDEQLDQKFYSQNGRIDGGTFNFLETLKVL